MAQKIFTDSTSYKNQHKHINSPRIVVLVIKRSENFQLLDVGHLKIRHFSHSSPHFRSDRSFFMLQGRPYLASQQIRFELFVMFNHPSIHHRIFPLTVRFIFIRVRSYAEKPTNRHTSITRPRPHRIHE